MLEDKFPKKIVLKLYPYGLVDTNRLGVHYPVDNLKELASTILNHPETKFYYNKKRFTSRLTVNKGIIYLRGKPFLIKKNKIGRITPDGVDNVKNVIFGEYPFGYADLNNAAIHYPENKIVEIIKTNPSVHFYVDDKNTYLTVKENALVKIKRPIRKTLYLLFLTCCVIATPVALASGLLWTISKIFEVDAGKRPTQFYSGFSMNLWYHNRARLFVNKDRGSYDLDDITIHTWDDYPRVLKLITADKLYVMMVGTFLYSYLIVKPGDAATDTYYLPVQQWIDPTDEDNTGVNIRDANPLVNLYASNIHINVMRGITFEADGSFIFSLSYNYNWSNFDMSNNGSYRVEFSGAAKLTNNVAENSYHTNQFLYNLGLVPDDNAGGVTLKFTNTSGNVKAIQTTHFTDGSKVLWNDTSGSYDVFDTDKSYLPNGYNTDPSSQQSRLRDDLWTANIFRYWTRDY